MCTYGQQKRVSIMENLVFPHIFFCFFFCHGNLHALCNLYYCATQKPLHESERSLIACHRSAEWALKSFHSKRCKETRASGHVWGFVAEQQPQCPVPAFPVPVLDHRAGSLITCSFACSCADGPQGFTTANLCNSAQLWLVLEEGRRTTGKLQSFPSQMKHGGDCNELSAS